MAPSPAILDVAYLLTANAEPRGYRGMGADGLSYRVHIRNRQFGQMAPLLSGVQAIISVIAEKQMRRIDAGAVVAMVTGKHTERDWAEVNLPGDTVGLETAVPLATSATPGDPTVTFRVRLTCPEPAMAQLRSVGRDWPVLINSQPEAISEGPTEPTCGRIGVHDYLQCGCATPQAVTAALRHLLGHRIAHPFSYGNSVRVESGRKDKEANSATT